MLNKNCVILGVDEAGRGALAGPVVACAVSFKSSFNLFHEINDSKQLTEKKRTHLFHCMVPHVSLGVGIVTHRYIDTANILDASLLAMQKAIRRIGNDDYYVIVDGKNLPDIPCSCEARVKADATVAEVMAASICAKVLRDRLMVKYSGIYNQYNFELNKGYGTRAHYNGLYEFGHSPIHRKTFNLNKQLTLFSMA